MKKNLRMLALGFLVSAVVLLVYDQFFSTPTKADETNAAPTKDVADDNSNTWKAKYEKLLAQQEVDKAADEAAKKKEEEAKKVKSYTLTISKGDPSSKAGEELQANGIIKSASEFDKYLKDNNYEKYVRDGKYNLKSDMSYETIAKILAHKN
ncbi:endolytic transglycosylase MltG [Listeria seeligeri]|uniref:endolytic transglycosylase MltG n=1 Tax=Listeria seeligeri TaxID=1640 RepID=UPI0018893DA3|nr:endolytic transglycosylase MltG [Listeria seeligeri]MBF2649049.1 endolytic transglycosylase MltG [Listeria seeligeri]